MQLEGQFQAQRKPSSRWGEENFGNVFLVVFCFLGGGGFFAANGVKDSRQPKGERIGFVLKVERRGRVEAHGQQQKQVEECLQ